MPFPAEVLGSWATLGDRVAVDVAGERTSYAELAARAAAVAARLAELRPVDRDGPLRGCVVAVTAASNDVAQLEIFLGATAGTGVLALGDPRWTAERFQIVLEQLRPDILFCGQDGAGPRAAAAQLGLPIVSLGAGYRAWRNAAPPDAELPPTAPGDTPFLVGLTSGSTSLPKAFYLHRGTWRSSLRLSRERFEIDARSTTLSPLPLQNGYVLYAAMECLDAGATFRTLRRFDPVSFREALTGDVVRVVGVPSALQELARHTPPGTAFQSVERVTTTGARLDPGTARTAHMLFPAAVVEEYYGASETGFVTVREASARGGHPFPAVEVEVRDDDGRPVPAGVAGRLHVRSPLLAQGYLCGGDGRGLRRDAAGWATVGDRGRVLLDGTVELLGREGTMIVTPSGVNVFPEEVEAALRRHDAVEEAVVLAVEDPRLALVLVAVLRAAPGRDLWREELLAHCRRELDPERVPVRMHRAGQWPMTASGKISRRELAEWLTHGHPSLSPVPWG